MRVVSYRSASSSPTALSYGTGLIYSLPQLLAEHWASHSMTRHGGISSQRTRSSASLTAEWKSYRPPRPLAIRYAGAIFQGRTDGPEEQIFGGDEQVRSWGQSELRSEK